MEQLLGLLLTEWLTFALYVISIIFIIYGALVFKRKWTPLSAKVLVEEEFLEEWCKSEGKVRMLWGLDIALFAMYNSKAFLPYLWLGLFLVLTVYNIYLGYLNNRKYMKN